MKIELGAGEQPAPGYLALDVNPRAAAVIGSALHLPFRSTSIEALRAVDVLEHISYRDTEAALAEWARVLEPGGQIYIQVPDAHAAISKYLDWPADCARRHPTPKGALGWLEWVLLGGHLDGRYCKLGDDFRWNAHYSLWDEPTIRDALDVTGFAVSSIDRNSHPNLFVHARRRP